MNKMLSKAEGYLLADAGLSLSCDYEDEWFSSTFLKYLTLQIFLKRNLRNLVLKINLL